MKAFATGSRVYGDPGKESDIDLVVLTTPAIIDALAELADAVEPKHAPAEHSDPGPADRPGGVTASLKFGRLNLICVTDAIAYGVWLKGTVELSRAAAETGKPVTRDAAIAHFRALRIKHGLRLSPEAAEAAAAKRREAERDRLLLGD